MVIVVYTVVITLVLSEVFECLLAMCLDSFTEIKNLFINLEFSFCEGLGSGTFEALLTITGFCSESFGLML